MARWLAPPDPAGNAPVPSWTGAYACPVDDWAPVARTMWTMFESVHAVTYVAPEALSGFTDAGLRGFWRGYFAGRSAPLGVTSPEVVTASFYNFAPAFVARAIPGIWDLTTPAEALAVRMDGATAALRNLLDRAAAVTAAADLLWAAASELDFPGRVLSAAISALPVPEDSLGLLWHAATLLREHRGDGHFAALAAADIDGCEVVVLRSGIDLRRDVLQRARGWSDDQWAAAAERLTARGWLAPDGSATPAGRDAILAVEDATDRAAARPWQRLGPDAAADLVTVLRPIADSCGAVTGAVNALLPGLGGSGGE